MNPLLILVAGGLFAYNYIQSTVQAVKQLDYKIVNGDLIFKDLSLIMRLKVLFSNPTKKAIAIESFTASIFYDGSQVGQINYFEYITINPSGKTLVQIPVDLKTLAIAQLISKIVQTKKFNGKFRVKGSINTSAGTISFDQVINGGIAW